MAPVEELTERQTSDQAKVIIQYCSRFGTEMGFPDGTTYRYLQCDPSMVFFYFHCLQLSERLPFDSHYCSQSSDLIQSLEDYSEFRQLMNEFGPGFFYQIPNPEAFDNYDPPPSYQPPSPSYQNYNQNGDENGENV